LGRRKDGLDLNLESRRHGGEMKAASSPMAWFCFALAFGSTLQAAANEDLNPGISAAQCAALGEAIKAAPSQFKMYRGPTLSTDPTKGVERYKGKKPFPGVDAKGMIETRPREAIWDQHLQLVDRSRAAAAYAAFEQSILHCPKLGLKKGRTMGNAQDYMSTVIETQDPKIQIWLTRAGNGTQQYIRLQVRWSQEGKRVVMHRYEGPPFQLEKLVEGARKSIADLGHKVLIDKAVEYKSGGKPVYGMRTSDMVGDYNVYSNNLNPIRLMIFSDVAKTPDIWIKVSHMGLSKSQTHLECHLNLHHFCSVDIPDKGTTNIVYARPEAPAGDGRFHVLAVQALPSKKKKR
jgi:hypothetical protein